MSGASEYIIKSLTNSIVSAMIVLRNIFGAG